jgi:hypothetical protein
MRSNVLDEDDGNWCRSIRKTRIGVSERDDHESMRIAREGTSRRCDEDDDEMR